MITVAESILRQNKEQENVWLWAKDTDTFDLRSELPGAKDVKDRAEGEIICKSFVSLKEKYRNTLRSFLTETKDIVADKEKVVRFLIGLHQSRLRLMAPAKL